MMIILSLFHNIFLTPEEIGKLCSGEDIEIIGASLPVWYYRGNTSEPAEEVFCKYLLTNKKNDSPNLISIRDDRSGYNINMPQIPEGYIPRSISDDDWRKMNDDEQSMWYEMHPVPLSVKNLRPITEGGAEYLHFREQNVIQINNRNVNAVHVVEIKTIEALIDSFD